MKAEVNDKPFDCVAFQREARARMSEKMASMGHQEFRQWVRASIAADPALAKLLDGSRDAKESAPD